MGYTHYYNLKNKASKTKWNRFVEQCKTLYKNLPSDISVKGSGGKGQAGFGVDGVTINGDYDLDTYCEDLFLTPDYLGFEFTKTNRNDYDILVFACLIAANRTLGLLFKSDGYTDHPDYPKECNDLLPAMNYYNQTIDPKNKITGDPDLVTEDELWLIRKKFNNQRT